MSLRTTMDQRVESATEVPLVVDLDGTLIKVDSLHEACVQFASKKPLDALRALLKLREGRAAFKAAVAEHAPLDAETVPVDEAVLEAIEQARRDGRKVYLATASDRRMAEQFANAIGEFDGVFASDYGINLKGAAKADCLVAAFGEHGFDYIGNAAADFPVWRVARTALVSGASPRLTDQVSRQFPDVVVLRTRARAIAPYLLALRPHQWLKNTLVALPTIAAHDFSMAGLVTVAIAFLSFSLGASSVYLANDMLDLPHDRAHPQKRHRSIAAGLVPLSEAAGLLAVTAGLSIALAFMLPWAFLLVLISYFALSMSYSLYLKRKLMIDVVALAALYGIRVVAGAAATGVVLSHWLVGFCFFIFLSLALVKRTAEMVALSPDSVGKIKGRGYRRDDLPTITALTAASGLVAVLVLALYVNSPEVKALYRYPDLLWGISVILVYWLGRVCFLTGRGEMDQDPVLFAATDRVSLMSGVLVAIVFLVAL
jgi:4-hydroxybenzoate polyprenyltransferase/phosphoserine phosphatase